MPSPEPTEAEAKALVQFARELGGISVDTGKRDFIRTRLGPLLRTLKLDGYGALIDRAARSSRVKRAVMEALTTHTTSFFREARHFDWLREIALPDMMDARGTPPDPLTIWSAACSTGAELWSAAMAVEAFAESTNRRLRVRLIGSDVSERILRIARGATFTENEIGGIPEDLLKRYFLRADGALVNRPGHLYRVAAALRDRAEFRQLNLLEVGGQADFKADIVFLRNVLIYFDPPDRDRVVRAVLSRMHTDSVLLTGHSEALDARKFGLRQCAPSTYRKS